MATSTDMNIEQTIADNGGLGDWETDETETPSGVTRWMFPRFKGAGPEDSYLSRSGIGPNDTDVETLVSWLEAPRNIVGLILVQGDPGTGKTALIEAAAAHMDRELYTVLCTPDHTKDSLLTKFVGEGKGDNGTPFTLGPLAYAAKKGLILYLDEGMLLIDGVKPLIYSLADGRSHLPEGNVDGTPLKIHKDFRVVMSSNPQVRGASLPEPLASRAAGSTLTVETSAEFLTALGIDADIVSAWTALGVAGLWRPQIRELRVAEYWLDIDTDMAVAAMIPEHCPETQRGEVRSIVTSFVGGSVAADGRLRVS